MAILRIPHLEVSVDKKTIVSGGSLVIEKGDVVLLTGPNGCGKSTIIKLLMGDIFDYKGLRCGDTKAWFLLGDHEINIFEKEKHMEWFRRNVCYVSQEDVLESDTLLDCFLLSLNYCHVKDKEQYVLSFVKKFALWNCFGIQEGKLERKSRKLAKRFSMDVKSLTQEDAKALNLLSMKTSKLSGGQRKLANIVTNLVKCEFCKLVLLDEPLNNLDYQNVRTCSNLLTQLHRQYEELGFLLVTHCRSIPIVNKIVEIDVKEKKLVEGTGYVCNSCFGPIDCHGMYS